MRIGFRIDESGAYQRPFVRRVVENAQRVVPAAVEPVVGAVLRRFEIDPARADGAIHRSNGNVHFAFQSSTHIFFEIYVN